MPDLISTGIPALDRALLAAAALLVFLNWLCQILSHYFPATTPFGKFVSVVAGNAGKALIAIEKRPDPVATVAQVDGGAVLRKPDSRGFISLRIAGALAFALLGCSMACAFLTATKTNVVACAEADPALEMQVIDALVDAAEQQWMAALTALVPDKTLRDCLLEAILAAVEQPDGGFVFMLPDGGVVAPARLTSARQLGETDKQRVTRRAQTYFTPDPISAMAAEIPSGVVDGVNPTFTTVAVITNEQLFVDRIIQIRGTDYTTSGNVITFFAGAIPQPGALIGIYYTAAANFPSSGNPGITTLALLIQQIRERADLVNSQFITDPELTQFINASYYELYDLLVQKYGNEYYTATPYQLTTVNGQELYPLPANFYKLLGVDQAAQGSTRWTTVETFMFGERNMGSAADLPAGQLMQIWYVPRLSALVNNADSVDGVSGWEEYIVADCVIKCQQKAEEDASIAMAQKAALVSRIDAAAENRDAGLPQRVTDVNRSQGSPWQRGANIRYRLQGNSLWLRAVTFLAQGSLG